jgi:LPXTG-motif cell wall-anchored protein
MTRKILALAAGALATLAGALVLAGPAQATGGTTPNGPSFATCPNLTGWYANEDEQGDLPQATVAGLKFEGKDLIHHATSLDFTDFDKTNKSFEATTSGKVVFKAETSGPYSTIVINADGKLWSTAFKPEATGGQNLPVAKAEDLIGKPDSMKPGKLPYTAASRVVTFGVGYWVEAGSTVVRSISFHGHKYWLTCHPKPSTSPSASTSPTVKPSASASASATVKPSATTKAPTQPTTAAPSSSAPVVIVGTSGGTSLPVTGANGFILVGLGAIAVGGGLALLLAARRRKVNFTA